MRLKKEVKNILYEGNEDIRYSKYTLYKVFVIQGLGVYIYIYIYIHIYFFFFWDESKNGSKDCHNEAVYKISSNSDN